MHRLLSTSTAERATAGLTSVTNPIPLHECQTSESLISNEKCAIAEPESQEPYLNQRKHHLSISQGTLALGNYQLYLCGFREL
ncbi:hypothetical protein IFM47457_11411 [Aspergillus lentulus]|nr:hypothetical protein IFM47457_11411 [Aspergillus lentulus]